MNLKLGRPAALARVTGMGAEPCGTVFFFPKGCATLVVADIRHLPHNDGPCTSGIFALHIHEGDSCCGVDFADTGGHYNPCGTPHPEHAGDLPPLFECHGQAFLAVLTERFTVPDVIGRTVVIHSGPDDFTTQPAGNAGAKIACGVIRPI